MLVASLEHHRAPWWLPGGHAQTIAPALLARQHEPTCVPRFERERWRTPDADFIDVDWLVDDGLSDPAARPLLIVFHGLEGSSRSHYVQAFASQAMLRGWRMAVPHFRGCSGEINLAPRAYHSGDHEEIAWILARFAREHGAPVLAAGVSLGGNALLRWAEEHGHAAAQVVRAVAAISSPLDLTASGRAIGQGLCRLIYTRMFLRTMKPRALAKWCQHPGLFDRERMLASRDLHAFDDAFTAPLHGFAGVDDYWRRASSKPTLADIRVPSLVVNARNDPFVPAPSLPLQDQVGPCVTLLQPAHGGHVGFARSEALSPGRSSHRIHGAAPSSAHAAAAAFRRSWLPSMHVLGMPAAVMDWMAINAR